MNFFKQPKPRGFYYNNMYHDPHKQALEEKVKKAKEEIFGNGDKDLQETSEEIKKNIRSSFRNASHLDEDRHKGLASDPIKLIFLIAIIGLLIWVIYFMKY